MSRFLNNLKTEQIGKRLYRLLSPLTLDDEAGVFVVPEGFETDYGSINALHNAFLFVFFALLSGYGNRAATVHDYLYDQASISRKGADDIFYRALRADGIARWRAWIFWAGVRLFGSSSYGVKN